MFIATTSNSWPTIMALNLFWEMREPFALYIATSYTVPPAMYLHGDVQFYTSYITPLATPALKLSKSGTTKTAISHPYSQFLMMHF